MAGEEPRISEETVTDSTEELSPSSSQKQDQLNDQEVSCQECVILASKLSQYEQDLTNKKQELSASTTKLENLRNELEREVQRRCDLEQRFTEEAKRSSDQIEELIAKSKQDDSKLNELKRKFDIFTSEASSLAENFTINREMMTGQLMELRKENDYLLGKFIGKSRDLQSETINLPQTVEELQFYCLKLSEKLILATQAKEHLEEMLISKSNNG